MIRNLVLRCFTQAKEVFLILMVVILFINQYYLSNIGLDQNLGIYFLDVGQGDSILIKSPDNKILLIDGGPDDKVLTELGEVWGGNMKTIDLIILSHPDSDHVNGLLPLIDKYEVKTIIATRIKPTNQNYKNLFELIDKNNIPFIEPNEFTDIRLGCCVSIDFIWPLFDQDLTTISKTNNISNAFEIKYKNFNAFFAGDMDSEFEDFCVRKNPTDIDMLKVTHHGSLTSTSEELLERLNPEIAVISAGKDNSYGHPKAEILERLDSRNIKTFVTSDEGMIKFQTDGETLWKLN